MEKKFFVKEILKQSFLALLVVSIADLSAGIFLGHASERLLLLPGLLVLIPGAIDMRGAIFAALSSRLNTNLHLGLIPAGMRSPLLNQNIYSSIILTIIMCVYLGFLAKTICLLFGIHALTLEELILISLLGGCLAAIVLLLVAVFVSLKTFERGWDPDNVATPFITVAGDIVTIPSLLLAAEIVSRMDAGTITALCYFSIFFAGGMIFSVARMEVSEIKKIVYQSIPIFLLSGILSSFTGSILQLKIFQLVLLPSLFVLIPSFLQVGGSISCILASRLSSSLHCGLIAPEAKPSGDVLLNFWTILLLMLLIGPLLGFFSHALSIFIGFQSPGILTMVLITSLSGMLLALIANISTFYTTILSFHAGLDPDNVVIPAMTPLMDFAGICTLIFVFSIFGLV